MPYKHDVAQCDVQDRARLVTYREHRSKWVDWSSSDDPNSLENQFSSMFWFDAVFRLINEARRTHKLNLAVFSGLLAEMLDAGFVAGQVISIRRLVDKGSDVISLRRLARDIEYHRSLVTREVFVCYDGCPYDHELARQKLDQRRLGLAAPTWSSLEIDQSRRAHEAFDALSMTAAGNRRRTDTIDASAFAKVEKEISTCGADPLIKAANKFLFHAADAVSRKNVALLEITLGQLADVHGKLACVGNYLSGTVLYDGPCALGVATAQFDVLERLDAPFIDPADADDLREWWNRFASESQKLSHKTL